MFVGRTYREVGYGNRSIRFADTDGGVATTTFSYSALETAEIKRRQFQFLGNVVARLQ